MISTSAATVAVNDILSSALMVISSPGVAGTVVNISVTTDVFILHFFCRKISFVAHINGNN